jgi:hypothetical protein
MNAAGADADVQSYSAIGVTFSVASDDIGALELVDRLYAHCRVDGSPAHAFEIVHDDDGWALGLDGTAVLRDAPAALTLERFAWEVNQLAWASDRPGLFVHAGAVTLDGNGVMLCAGSARGKSTLTMGLCERGARYLSDEIAIVDLDASPRARMGGFTRPIALRDGSWALVDRLAPNCPPDVASFMEDVWFLVPQDVVDDAPVDVIVFPIYDEDARTRLEPISHDEAAAIVADQAPHLGALGKRGVDGTRAMVGAARLGRLVYSDLDEACALVRDLAVNERS